MNNEATPNNEARMDEISSQKQSSQITQRLLWQLTDAVKGDETVVNIEQARYLLGRFRRCSRCIQPGNINCPECEGVGKIPTPLGRNFVAGIKKAMGISSRYFFLKDMRKFIRDNPGFRMGLMPTSPKHPLVKEPSQAAQKIMNNKKQRAADQTTITFSLPKEMNDLIRERTAGLQVNTSAYLRMLLVKDLTGQETLTPAKEASGAHINPQIAKALCNP